MANDRSVAEVMTRDVVALTPSMSLKQMDEALVKHGVSGAPVVEKDELVGVASRSDAIRSLLEDQKEAARVSDFYSSPFPMTRSVLEYLSADARDLLRRMSDRRVRDVMSSSVVSVDASDPLQVAARTMADGGIHRLPVLEDGRLVGIVTSLDLVRVMAEANAT